MIANDEVELMLESRNSIPFYKFLGLTRDCFDAENGRITLPWRDELMGNPRTKVLHGGVIAAIMDAEAGFLLSLHFAKASTWTSKRKSPSGGTIDLLVDYLLPGKGRYFVASGNIRRIGKRVAVVETELHNDNQELIALGRATFMVG